MKRNLFFVSIFVICLVVSFLALDQIGLKKAVTRSGNSEIKSHNEVTADKNINILKLPLPNSDQRKYSVIKLPISGSPIHIKELNNKSLN
ncbi:hypothetical protein RAH41_01280 [Gottfriedia acidiceleris]|uniref:hypothetical protein n=1 Tax=Gottfriedia acidiceleris TaxID=371036 RepID=UPI002F262485